jgi:hypothetical protein
MDKRTMLVANLILIIVMVIIALTMLLFNPFAGGGHVRGVCPAGDPSCQVRSCNPYCPTCICNQTSP